MRHRAKYNSEFLQVVRGQKFRHPETGHRVQFQSLPSEEQKRYYQRWSARHQPPREDPKRKEEVDRKVNQFFERHKGRRIPEDPLAALQLMQFQGVLTKEDQPYLRHVFERIQDRIDEEDKEAEEREKKKPWWQRLMDIEASQKVASRWMHGIIATQIRTGRQAPKFKKLYIFDFDGTLFRSPLPKKDYEKESEEWWSDPESLGASTVGQKPEPEMWHEDTVKAMQDAIAEPDSYVVVMTGRNNVLQDRIQEILDSAGLKPDELITNPKIGDTTGYKRQEMQYLLRQFPNVREVEFWEDRKADLKGYERLGEELGVRFTPKLVKNYDRETPAYLGVFLTPEAKQKVLERFPAKHENLQADHVTLMFRPTDEDMEQVRENLQLGQKVPLKVTGYVEDEKGQALVVELPPEIQAQSRRSPHLTLSLAPGIEPIYSNELIQGNVIDVPPFELEGVLDGGPRSGSPPPKAKSGPPGLKGQHWLEYLQGEMHNPEFGKPGHHKERVKRKTVYDAGGSGKRQVMREWGPYLQRRRSRS